MEKVTDVYERPHDEKYPAVCPDESPSRFIGEKRRLYTDDHDVEHTDYEYIRNGTADIYMVTESSGGRREVIIRDRHTRIDRAEVVAHVVEGLHKSRTQCANATGAETAHSK